MSFEHFLLREMSINDIQYFSSIHMCPQNSTIYFAHLKHSFIIYQLCISFYHVLKYHNLHNFSFPWKTIDISPTHFASYIQRILILRYVMISSNSRYFTENGPTFQYNHLTLNLILFFGLLSLKPSLKSLTKVWKN